MAFLRFGAPEGQWNIGLFKAAADLSRCGTPPDKIIEMLESVSGYLDSKDTQTIRSALKAVEAEWAGPDESPYSKMDTKNQVSEYLNKLPTLQSVIQKN